MKVTVFGAEPRVNYNRIMLSPVLAGEKKFEDIVIYDEDWYDRNGVVLRRGETDRRDRSRVKARRDGERRKVRL